MSEDSYAPRPCVYIITHVPTKRHYVGKANDVRKRWSQHRYAASSTCKSNGMYITAAMRKYGIAQFQFAVAEEFDTEEDAFESEIWWIEFLRSDTPGYGFNRSSGGERSGEKRIKRSAEYWSLVASQRLDMRYDSMRRVHGRMSKLSELRWWDELTVRERCIENSLDMLPRFHKDELARPFVRVSQEMLGLAVHLYAFCDGRTVNDVMERAPLRCKSCRLPLHEQRVGGRSCGCTPLGGRLAGR